MQRNITCALLGALLFGYSPPAKADHGYTNYVEAGQVATGFNRYLDQPIWFYQQLEDTIPGTGLAGFQTGGEFDAVLRAGNGNSIPLTGATPESALMASFVDFPALAGFGLSEDSVPDRVLNVPYDDTEVLVDPFGVVRIPVPCSSDVGDPLFPSRAAPCTESITLGDWNEAWGILTDTCYDAGGATIRIAMGGLIPNRMYTVWGDFEALEELGALAVAMPLGGIHNVVVSNKYGIAYFERDLEFCPHEDERSIGVFVAMRPAGQNYGGTPVPFLNQENPETAFEGFDGAFPGTHIVVHLQFDLGNGELLL